jgi:long-subunit acyl-CoA synthetase (AMP-forming)
MDAKLVDDEGNDITDYDVRGELCARGPLIVKGYYNNPRANAESWDRDGYFHTGDIAMRRRDNGLWYIVDRKKVPYYSPLTLQQSTFPRKRPSPTDTT